MNALQKWVRESREEQRRAPNRYLAAYPELQMDDTFVYMTIETFAKIEKNCGRYDGCMPTGEYLGKMFLRGNGLLWFGISKSNPLMSIALRFRKIVILTQEELDARSHS